MDFLKNYKDIILLLFGIIAGSIAGLVLGDKTEYIKPIGDVFLNLLFTVVIPLVFFAVSSAIAQSASSKMGRTVMIMMLVFLSTLFISAYLTIVATWIFPIHDPVVVLEKVEEAAKTTTIGDDIVQLLTADNFFTLLSRQKMLALIIFSVLMGAATLKSGEKGDAFKQFLFAGNEVMTSLLKLIMKLAPIGLGAYFAYQVGVVGPQLFGTYAKSLGLYYGFGIFYFLVVFSLYAFIAGGFSAVKRYWKNNIVPSVTALGTCSSIATIPANLEAAQKMGVSAHIRNIVVPLGASLHKDGSSISSVIKIAVAFAMFNKDITGVEIIVMALLFSVLASVVEGGIPNGGYVGELLLISAYHLPPSALPAMMIIGTLVDPLATVLNATGDTVCAMIIQRFSGEEPDPAPDLV